ncbi:MAG: hypothetical protein Q9N67_05165 [Ghiorsea sp.]|nr:hypothetical protein [Ghiorsea sp.]
MKKVLFVFIVSFISLPALAATLNISQVLTPAAGITIVGSGAINAGSGSATINITPSNTANYVITVSDGTAGAFLLTHTGGTTVGLAVDIDGTAIATSGSTFTNNAPTNGGTDAHTLGFTSAATAASASGTYTTALTITVAAN